MGNGDITIKQHGGQALLNKVRNILPARQRVEASNGNNPRLGLCLNLKPAIPQNRS